MPPEYSGCWAKIERAKEHRDALDAYITEQAAIESNRPRLGVKFDAQSGNHIAYVNYMPDITTIMERTSVILGDIAHNLRSGLDHLVFQLALANTQGRLPNYRRVQFPIEDKPTRFNTRCTDKGNQGWIADLSPVDQAIIEEFQPYKRGHGLFHQKWIATAPISIGTVFSHDLATLRDLSDTDKHRLLASVSFEPSHLQIVEPIVAVLANSYFTQSMARFGVKVVNRVELGAELFWAEMPVGTQHEVKVAGYLLPEVMLADGRAVIHAVDRMAATVVNVIRKFDPI